MSALSLLLRHVVLLLPLLGSLVAHADEFRPAYLELKQISAESYDVLWKLPAQGERLRLALYVRLPPGTENVSEPRGAFFGGTYVERWRIARPGGFNGQRIGIEGLSGTSTDVLVRVQRLDGSAQVERLLPSQTAFVVKASAGGPQVAETYLRLGIGHILLGVDHLLFVLALLILVQGWRRLVVTITAFTVAHSLTLAAATFGVLRVPQAPVEALIALSILFVAVEIVHTRAGRPALAQQWPWAIAFAFGLLHGLGFAGALREIGLPEHAIPLALLFFNIGVELGQLAFVAAVLGTIPLWRRLPLPSWAWRVPVYCIGTASAFWMMERTAVFWA